MQCSCGGALIKGKSSYTISENDFCYILDNIPAFQCMRCKKVLFEDDVVDKITDLKKRLKRYSDEIIGNPPSVNLRDY